MICGFIAICKNELTGVTIRCDRLHRLDEPYAFLARNERKRTPVLLRWLRPHPFRWHVHPSLLAHRTALQAGRERVLETQERCLEKKQLNVAAAKASSMPSGNAWVIGRFTFEKSCCHRYKLNEIVPTKTRSLVRKSRAHQKPRSSIREKILK